MIIYVREVIIKGNDDFCLSSAARSYKFRNIRSINNFTILLLHPFSGIYQMLLVIKFKQTFI